MLMIMMHLPRRRSGARLGDGLTPVVRSLAESRTLYLKESHKTGIHESRTSEDQPIIRYLRSEVVHLKASAMPPKLTRNLEAKIGSQKYEIPHLQRDLHTTQDSLD